MLKTVFNVLTISTLYHTLSYLSHYPPFSVYSMVSLSVIIIFKTIQKESFDMESKTFQVPNMTCNGCVSTVRTEIEELSGIVNVDINKPAQLVTVEWDSPASWDNIKSALTEIEYPPVEVE